MRLDRRSDGPREDGGGGHNGEPTTDLVARAVSSPPRWTARSSHDEVIGLEGWVGRPFARIALTNNRRPLRCTYMYYIGGEHEDC
jgi:hypothetical protein